ncbi:LacI family DNA-binding transcriptional regulator [Pseudonocardia sp. GCM10023141]|uniref:LacI family DNA-binding transcriptional regulator n=1 Tax=Pseudonocardia sp. GCM10023141 TaxID=3252653 RepID=UPI00361FB854
MQRRRRTTLKDVAAATGLSPAAVSYALRGLQVPVETQERVRAAARELGYEVNPIARALAGGRTGMVGVLCGSLEDLWQQGLAVQLSRGLLAKDRYAIITDANGEPDRERQLARQLLDQQVDGVLVSPLDPAADFWADLSAAVPVVTIGDALLAAPKAGCVLFDNRHGVAMALEHLADLGHRRVAVLTPSTPSTPDRPAGVFAKRHGEELGLDVVLVGSPASVAGAAAAAEEVLAVADRPTAMFCLSDSMAYGCYLAARRLDLAVPTDLSVLGYDDHETAELVVPPLTTFAWDRAGIVESAVAQLVRAIEAGGRRRPQTFRPELVERGSTAVAQSTAPSGERSSSS